MSTSEQDELVPGAEREAWETAWILRVLALEGERGPLFPGGFGGGVGAKGRRMRAQAEREHRALLCSEKHPSRELKALRRRRAFMRETGSVRLDMNAPGLGHKAWAPLPCTVTPHGTPTPTLGLYHAECAGRRWRVRGYPGHLTVLYAREHSSTALGERSASGSEWIASHGRPVVQRLRRRIFRAILAALALVAPPGTPGAP